MMIIVISIFDVQEPVEPVEVPVDDEDVEG